MAELGQAERVAMLAERLGFPFAEPRRVIRALTHKSFANENRALARDDNERLEFLGDAVIDLAVSHRLMELCPEAREGQLSRLRAGLVNEDGLARVARAVGLGELLYLGRGEELTGGRDKSSLLADALEAVLAAIYLEGGLPAVLAVVERVFGSALAQARDGTLEHDYKSELQELAQALVRSAPRYRVIKEEGPEHAKTFEVEVTVGGEAHGQGSGRNKKDAEQAAARAALRRMGQGTAGEAAEQPSPSSDSPDRPR